MRRAERDLLKCAVREHIAALVGLREAAAKREAKRQRSRDSDGS